MKKFFVIVSATLLVFLIAGCAAKKEVGLNETLKVNQFDGKYNFEMKVASINENVEFKNVFDDENYPFYEVVLNIKNRRTDGNLGLVLMAFTLYDENNNILGRTAANVMYADMPSVPYEIESGAEQTVKLYFSNEDNSKKAIDASKVDKMLVEVPSDAKVNDAGSTKISRNEFYIDLK